MPTVLTERPRTATVHRDVLVKSFTSLSEALGHARNLAARRQGYRVTVRSETGPIAWTLQVVDQDSVFGDGQFGLTVLVSGPADVLARLRRLCRHAHCVSSASTTDSRFAIHCGTDLAARDLIERLWTEANDNAGGLLWTVVRRGRACR
jgi:hypothetical protein